jgi:hypothetical protein
MIWYRNQVEGYIGVINIQKNREFVIDSNDIPNSTDTHPNDQNLERIRVRRFKKSRNQKRSPGQIREARGEVSVFK